MNIRDGNHRRVSFDMREELGDKIDKIVMIGKLATKMVEQIDNSNPKSITVEV